MPAVNPLIVGTSISGAMPDGFIYWKDRTGSHRRPYKVPANPNTEAQQRVRNRLGGNAKAAAELYSTAESLIAWSGNAAGMNEILFMRGKGLSIAGQKNYVSAFVYALSRWQKDKLTGEGHMLPMYFRWRGYIQAPPEYPEDYVIKVWDPKVMHPPGTEYTVADSDGGIQIEDYAPPGTTFTPVTAWVQGGYWGSSPQYPDPPFIAHAYVLRDRGLTVGF